MSTNATISDFVTKPETESEPGVEIEGDPEPQLTIPEWATNNDWKTNHQCNGCGAPVSPRYHFFQRDEDGVLRRCPHCVSQTDMKKGAGAVDDYERRGAGDDDQTPTDALFGSADTSELPDYMTGGVE